MALTVLRRLLITYGDIRIYKNGDITDKKNKFNLRTAEANKTLFIGWSAGIGAEGTNDPQEVIVSETGSAMWNKKIKFYIITRTAGRYRQLT